MFNLLCSRLTPDVDSADERVCTLANPVRLHSPIIELHNTAPQFPSDKHLMRNDDDAPCGRCDQTQSQLHSHPNIHLQRPQRSNPARSRPAFARMEC